MDGVLYDSMPNHARSWQSSMATFGLHMEPEDAYRYEGMRGVETIQLLARQQWGRAIPMDEARRMYAVKTEAFAQCPPARIMPGAVQFMDFLAARGCKIVVVTGSGQRSLLDKLATDFAPYVRTDMIVSALDVEHGKPAPEPYLKGLAKTGAAPADAIVIENAPLGIRSAVAARIPTIAINTGPLPDSVLLKEGAMKVVKTYDQMMREYTE